MLLISRCRRRRVPFLWSHTQNQENIPRIDKVDDDSGWKGEIKSHHHIVDHEKPSNVKIKLKLKFWTIIDIAHNIAWRLNFNYLIVSLLRVWAFK